MYLIYPQIWLFLHYYRKRQQHVDSDRKKPFKNKFFLKIQIHMVHAFIIIFFESLALFLTKKLILDSLYLYNTLC